MFSGLIQEPAQEDSCSIFLASWYAQFCHADLKKNMHMRELASGPCLITAHGDSYCANAFLSFRCLDTHCKVHFILRPLVRIALQTLILSLQLVEHHISGYTCKAVVENLLLTLMTQASSKSAVSVTIVQ